MPKTLKINELEIKTGDLGRLKKPEFFHVATLTSKNRHLFQKGAIFRISVVQMSPKPTRALLQNGYLPGVVSTEVRAQLYQLYNAEYCELKHIRPAVARNYAGFTAADMVDKAITHGLHYDTLVWMLHFVRCDAAGQLKTTPALSLARDKQQNA